jgi:hypothetical protein
VVLAFPAAPLVGLAGAFPAAPLVVPLAGPLGFLAEELQRALLGPPLAFLAATDQETSVKSPPLYFALSSSA